MVCARKFLLLRIRSKSPALKSRSRRNVAQPPSAVRPNVPLPLLLLLGSILLASFASQALAAAKGEPIILWPGGAPGALGSAAEDIPNLTPFLPDGAASTPRAAIIVCPGGGYGHLAPHEGAPIAEWIAANGIAGFVLQYRIAPKYHHPAPLADAQRAIRTVRARAAEFGVDPKRIGIIGFSAGGHLASSTGTHFDAGDAKSEDPIERASCRPDLMILGYPVISMGETGHAGSRKNLLGDPAPPELVKYFSNELQVTAETPPAFLLHTRDDGPVPVENSLLFAAALRAADVPYEMHIFESGPHGIGLGGPKRPDLALWPKLCEAWLARRGFIAPTKQ